MAFVVGTMFRAWLLILLAEFGDKTFVLGAVFGAWCPWCGIRDHAAGLAASEYLIVFSACYSALVVRSLLLIFGVNPFSWSGFCCVGAFLILFCLALKAVLEWRRSYAVGVQDAEQPSREEPRAAEERGANAATLEDGGKSYGTLVLPGSTATRGFPDGRFEVLCTAFLLPGLSTLFAEACDRSSGVLETADNSRVDVALGALLAFFTSVSVSILIGYSMKKYVPERWLLFIIMVALWIVDFCCLRDALLRLMLGSLPMSTLSVWIAQRA